MTSEQDEAPHVIVQAGLAAAAAAPVPDSDPEGQES